MTERKTVKDLRTALPIKEAREQYAKTTRLNKVAELLRTANGIARLWNGVYALYTAVASPNFRTSSGTRRSQEKTMLQT